MKRKIKEATIEALFVRECKKLGLRAYKWVSPGCAGVPDRIVVHPDGVVSFVELKAPRGCLRPRQKAVAADLVAKGHTYRVLRSVDDVLSWVKDIETWNSRDRI